MNHQLALYKDIGEAKAALSQARGFIDETLAQNGIGFVGVVYSLTKDNEMAFSGNMITPPSPKHRAVVINILSQMARDLDGSVLDPHRNRHGILGPLIRKIFHGKKE